MHYTSKSATFEKVLTDCSLQDCTFHCLLTKDTYKTERNIVCGKQGGMGHQPKTTILSKSNIKLLSSSPLVKVLPLGKLSKTWLK